MGAGQSKKAKAAQKAKQNKANVGACCVIVAIILIVIALIVNELILYSDPDVNDTSVRWGWDIIETCLPFIGCIDMTFEDACDLCLDDDCEACQMTNAGNTWLALNVIALVVAVAIALIILAAGLIPALQKVARFTKFLVVAVVILVVVALITYYSVADDTGMGFR
eukprot:UN08815